MARLGSIPNSNVEQFSLMRKYTRWRVRLYYYHEFVLEVVVSLSADVRALVP